MSMLVCEHAQLCARNLQYHFCVHDMYCAWCLYIVPCAIFAFFVWYVVHQIVQHVCAFWWYGQYMVVWVSDQLGEGEVYVSNVL